MISEMRPEDLAAVRELHRRTRYEFALPEVLESAHVMKDQGRIVGMAAAERTAHVFMVIDPSWGSPHQKMELIESFHYPLAAALLASGIQHAFTFVEPQYRRYIQRLQPLGWSERSVCLSISQAEVQKRLRRAA